MMKLAFSIQRLSIPKMDTGIIATSKVLFWKQFCCYGS